MGLFDNLNDPIVQAKMMMAAGLLAPVRNKGWRGFAEATGQGLQQGLLGYTTGARTQEAVKRGEMERQLEQARLDQMKQANEMQNRQREVLGSMPDFSRPSLPDMAPTNENAAKLAQAPKPLPHEVMLKRAEYLSQKGLPDLADKYYQNADRLRPEVKEVRQVVQNGTPADIVVYKDGTHQVLPYGSAVKQELADFGGSKGVWNPITGQVGAQYGKTMAPGEADASARGWAGLSQAERHFQAGQAKPQLVEGEDGYKWVTPPSNGVVAPPVSAGVAGGKNKPSEGELTAAGYANRMLNAEKIISDLGEKGHQGFGSYAAGALVGAKVNPAIGRAVEQFNMNPEQQKFRQAQEDWVRAKLRKESGAVIADDEMAREITTYFPQPWDSPEVIEQKAKARQVANEQMALASGKAKSKVKLHESIDDIVNKYLKR